MSRLRDFPIDVLKIDKSFTMALRGSDDSLSFARAVFSFGAGLGLRVVAEGVETRDHLPGLIQLHCDWSQGYYFSRPVAPDVLADMLGQSCPLPLPATPAEPLTVAAAG